MKLRPVLSRLRRVLLRSPEIRREAADVLKATARAAKSVPAHLREVKQERHG